MSPLLFVISMIPLSFALRKSKVVYESTNKTKINYLSFMLFMDDLKLYAKDMKQLDSLVHTVRIFSKDIGMRFGIDKRAILILKRGVLTRSEAISLLDESIIQALEKWRGTNILAFWKQVVSFTAR